MIIFVIGAALLVIAVYVGCSARLHANKEIKEFEEKGVDTTVAKKARTVGTVISIVFALIAVAMIGFNSFYTQDAGEVVVLRSFSGNIEGSTSETGFHFKAPWTTCIRYDIRNNVI